MSGNITPLLRTEGLRAGGCARLVKLLLLERGGDSGSSRLGGAGLASIATLCGGGRQGDRGRGQRLRQALAELIRARRTQQ